MTTVTGTNDISMIHGRRCPGRGSMTIIAGIAGLDMCRRFACGRCAIVTGIAGTGHIAVIKMCRRPCRRRVAAATVIATLDVSG